MIKFKQGWPRKLRPQTPLKPTLQGFRIFLRAPVLEDYPRWSEVRRKNKQFLEPYEPVWSNDGLSQEFFIRRLERQKKEFTEGRGAFFLIHDKSSGNILGGINLNNIQFGAARQASLGYWLDQEYQGQRYMTEAARLLIDHAFNTLKLRRLNAACLPDNDQSIKLLTTLGFEEEGYAKAYLQINGQWEDHRLFGLLCPSA